jgi:hypothetical protein
MSTAYSIARRTFKHNGLFAGAACAMALALTAGPAFAQSSLDRVEVSGRVIEAPVRYDVRESCLQADAHLQKRLLPTFFREREYGNVDVRFVVTNGEVQAVQAHGMSFKVSHDVRRAVKQLECTNAQAGTSIYHLRVAFTDPAAPEASNVARADQPYTFALVAKR